MQNRDDAAANVTNPPVLGYTQEPPVLREEYGKALLLCNSSFLGFIVGTDGRK